MYHSSDIYKGIVIELLWKLVTGLNMSLICCRVFVINYEFLNTQTVAILCNGIISWLYNIQFNTSSSRQWLTLQKKNG